MFNQTSQRGEPSSKKAPHYPGRSLLINDDGSKDARLRETKDISLKIKRLIRDKLEVLQDREELVAKGIPLPNLFDRLQVYYSCSTACVQEIACLLQMWDLRELGEANSAIFDCFRCMLDIVMAQYSVVHERLYELERRKVNTVTIQEPFSKPGPFGNVTLQGIFIDKSEEPSTAFPAQTPGKMRSVDSFRGATSPRFFKQKTGLKSALMSRTNSIAVLGAQTPSLAKSARIEGSEVNLGGSPKNKPPHAPTFDFTTTEELKAREEQEQRDIQDKLRIVRAGLREGKFVDVGGNKDPRLMIAINKELCADMIQNNLEQRRHLNSILNGIEAVSANKAEAPAHLEKVLAEQKKILEQLNVGLEDQTEYVNSTQILKNLSDAEAELFHAFSDKQHELIVKMLKVIQNHKPGMATKMVATKMSNAQVDHLLSGKELADARKQIKALELQIMKMQVEMNRQSKEYDQVYSRARIAETMVKEKDQELEKLNLERLKAGVEQSNSRAQLEVLKSKQTQDVKGKDTLERELDDLRRLVKQYENDRLSMTSQMKDLLDKLQLEQSDLSARDIQESFLSDKERLSEGGSKFKSSSKFPNSKDPESAPPKLQSIFFKAISQFMISPKKDAQTKAKIVSHKQTQTLPLPQQPAGAAQQKVIPIAITTANNLSLKSAENLLQQPKNISAVISPQPPVIMEPDTEELYSQLQEELSQDSRRDSLAADRSTEGHKPLKPVKKSLHAPRKSVQKPKQKDTSVSPAPKAEPTKKKPGESSFAVGKNRNSLVPPVKPKERRGSIVDLPKTQKSFAAKRNSVSLESLKLKYPPVKLPELVNKIKDNSKAPVETEESVQNEKQEEDAEDILTPTLRKNNPAENPTEPTEEPTFYSNRTARNHRELLIPEAISEIPEIGSLDEPGHIMLAIDSLKKLPSISLVFDVISIVEMFLNKEKPYHCKLGFFDDNIQLIEQEVVSVVKMDQYCQVELQLPSPQPLLLPRIVSGEPKDTSFVVPQQPMKPTHSKQTTDIPPTPQKPGSHSDLSIHSARSRKQSIHLLPPAPQTARNSFRNLPSAQSRDARQGGSPKSAFARAKDPAPTLSLFKPRPFCYIPPPTTVPSEITAADEESRARTRLLHLLADKTLFYSQPTKSMLPNGTIIGASATNDYGTRAYHTPTAAEVLNTPDPDLSTHSPALQALFFASQPPAAVNALQDMQHSRFFYVRRQYERFAAKVRMIVEEHQTCGKNNGPCLHLQRVERLAQENKWPLGDLDQETIPGGGQKIFLHKVDLGKAVKDEELKSKVYIVHRGVQPGNTTRSTHVRSKTLSAWM